MRPGRGCSSGGSRHRQVSDRCVANGGKKVFRGGGSVLPAAFSPTLSLVLTAVSGPELGAGVRELGWWPGPQSY